MIIFFIYLLFADCCKKISWSVIKQDKLTNIETKTFAIFKHNKLTFFVNFLGFHIKPDTEVQRVRFPWPTSPEVVRSSALPRVVFTDKTHATDSSCRGGRLSNARFWHLRWHSHSLCGTFCLQILPSGIETQGQRIFLEDAQLDVFLTGKNI